MSKKGKSKLQLHATKVRRYPRRNPANPEASARQLYELFHGRPSKETVEVETEHYEHGWLAALGDLVELQFISASADSDGNPYLVTLEFDEPRRPILCSNEQGSQMYIEGGGDPPNIDFAEFEMDGPEWLKDRMVLGTLAQITYETEKQFHQFQLIEYYHQLGEETSVFPALIYDALNRRLEIAGGQYQIRWEGIVN